MITEFETTAYAFESTFSDVRELPFDPVARQHCDDVPDDPRDQLGPDEEEDDDDLDFEWDDDDDE